MKLVRKRKGQLAAGPCVGCGRFMFYRLGADWRDRHCRRCRRVYDAQAERGSREAETGGGRRKP